MASPSSLNGKRPSPDSSADGMDSPSRTSQEDPPQGIASQLLDMIRKRQKLQKSSGEVSNGMSCVPPEFGISFPTSFKSKEKKSGSHYGGGSFPATGDYSNGPSRPQTSELDGLTYRAGHCRERVNGHPLDKDVLLASASLALPDERSVMGSNESVSPTPGCEFECNAPYPTGQAVAPIYYEIHGNGAPHKGALLEPKPPSLVDFSNSEPVNLDIEVDQLFSELESFLPYVEAGVLESPSVSKFDNSWPSVQEKIAPSPNEDTHRVLGNGLPNPNCGGIYAENGVIQAPRIPKSSQSSTSSSSRNPDFGLLQNDQLVSTASKIVDSPTFFAYDPYMMHQPVPTPAHVSTHYNEYNMNGRKNGGSRSNGSMDAFHSTDPAQSTGYLNSFKQNSVYEMGAPPDYPMGFPEHQNSLSGCDMANAGDAVGIHPSPFAADMDIVPNMNNEPNRLLSQYSYRMNGTPTPYHQPPLPFPSRMTVNNINVFSHDRGSPIDLTPDHNSTMSSTRGFLQGFNPPSYPGTHLHLQGASPLSGELTPDNVSRQSPGHASGLNETRKDLYSQFRTWAKPHADDNSHHSQAKKDANRIPFCFASRPVFNQLESLLFLCADSIDRGDLQASHNIMQALNAMVSPHGSAMQRMAYYFLEGLAARIIGTGSAIYQALQSRSGSGSGPANKELMKALLVFLEACPYVPFAHIAANNAILEAVEGCERIHIIDFGITHGTQWPTLIELLAKRSKGPPHLRITGVDAPQTGLKPSSIQETGRRLSSFAKLVGVPFEFSYVAEHLEDLRPEQFEIREGEVVVANCVLRLHQIFHESKETGRKSPRDSTLQMIHDFSPKIVILVEQHTDHNHPCFKTRFKEAISYFTALFDSVEAAFEWNSSERVLIEERVFGRKIINIVACEGNERIERHEPHEQWHTRMVNVGFQPKCFSADVIDSLQSLLKRHHESYGLDLSDHSVMLTWRKKKVFAASTWEVRK